jgi:hypothetical protein
MIQGTPGGLAVDSASVTFTLNVGAGGVLAVPLDGGSPVTLVSGQGYPNAVAVDATHVFWTDYAENGSVMQVAR